MYSGPITVYSGVRWGGDYIDLASGGGPLNLAAYELQMNAVDAVTGVHIAAFSLDVDPSTAGRVWPSMTANDIALLVGKQVIWGLLIRSAGNASSTRLIGTGSVKAVRGPSWQ